MLKLSRALGEWRPAHAAPAADPLALLQAGWPQIVGAQVAANSAPLRISEATLAIVTRSSAWSHQLSFLAERILEAISVRVPEAGIRRLRFRVGRIPKRPTAPPTRLMPAAPVRQSPEEPPPADAGEALTRFANRVEQARRRKRAAGWKECVRCAALLAPAAGERCATCSSAEGEARERAAAQLLFEAPWLGFDGTAALVNGLCVEEYERVRGRLLKSWWRILEQARTAGRLSRSGRERLVASSYVLLRSKIPPERIMPATIRSVLGEELHALLYADEQRG